MNRAQAPEVGAQLPEIVEAHHDDPRARGEIRGRVLGERVGLLHDTYAELLRTAGQDVADRSGLLAQTADAVHRWWPEGAAEIEGIAAGAGVPVEAVWCLNARTELLAEARRRGAGPAARECSVAVRLDPDTGRSIGVQTWDWHDHMVDSWHPVAVSGGRLPYVGMTESGIIAKIGVNGAGVGVHLDILFHDGDRAGGVPVHLVCGRVLAEATSVAEAVEIARSAGVSASSAVSVHDGSEAVTVELSPVGAELVPPQRGWLVHTNRFQTPRLRAGEHRRPDEVDADADAWARQAVLRERASRTQRVDGAGDLFTMLDTDPDHFGRLTCLPADDDPVGQRWHTLATMITRPGEREFDIKAGVPLGAAPLRTFAVAGPRAADG